MIETKGLIGGEESGGYAFRGHLPERDGVLAALYFLDFMARTGKRPSELLAELYARVGPHYYDRVDIRMPASEKDAVLNRVAAARPESVAGVKVTEQDTTDGFRFNLENGGWLLLRFSGTEPLLRIYTEVPDKALVPELLKAGRELAGLPEGGEGVGCTRLTIRRRTRVSTPTACAVAYGACRSSVARRGGRRRASASRRSSRTSTTSSCWAWAGRRLPATSCGRLAMRHSGKPVVRASRLRPAAVRRRADAGRGVELQRRDGGDAVVVRASARRAVEEDRDHDGREAAGAGAGARDCRRTCSSTQGEPRSALGHSLMSLLALAEAAGVLPDQSREVDEAIALMEELRREIGDACRRWR